MADLAVGDVTITIQTGAPHNPRIEGTKRKSLCKIAFGDSALTYPADGVPMPTFEKWGLTRNIEGIVLVDTNDASAILWKYDLENHKLRGFHGGAELVAATDAPPAQVFYAEAFGW